MMLLVYAMNAMNRLLFATINNQDGVVCYLNEALTIVSRACNFVVVNLRYKINDANHLSELLCLKYD